MTGGMQDKSLKGGFTFPWPFPEGKPSTLYRLKSRMITCFVGACSKIMFVGGANKLAVKNKDRLIKLLEERKDRPLITVSNHRCNIDDPLMWTLQTLREFRNNIDRQRYTLTAHNICFTKQWHTTIFSLGRCVPCVRGEGVYQKGMDFCLQKMKEDCAWVHVFPEGRVVEDHKPIRLKWGVGRLIMECTSPPPILLPIWVNGMDKVWPNHPPFYPKFGNTVEITIGEPVDTQELIEKHKSDDAETARKKVTDIVQALLYGLGERVGGVPPGTILAVEEGDKSRKQYY